jgi:NAD+ diphosphatase
MDFRFCPRCASPLALRSIADDGHSIDRLACPAEACGFIHWSNPVPAVGVLVEHEGDMVLARGRGWPEGWFALVAGYLEAREDPKAGVAREVREEMGLEVVEAHLIGNYIFERKNEIMLCYHAIARGTIRLSEELLEVKRFKPADLRPWRRATGLAVADWMRARNLEIIWDERPALQQAQAAQQAQSPQPAAKA